MVNVSVIGEPMPNHIYVNGRLVTLGNVYFMADNLGHIKIGVSEDVGSRRKELQTANPMRLVTVMTLVVENMLAARGVESHLHRMFKNDNTFSKEWFYADNVLDFLLNDKLKIGAREFDGYPTLVKKLRKDEHAKVTIRANEWGIVECVPG